MDLLPILEATTYNLYLSTLANKSEIGRRLFDRMSNPQIGDMVMEITTYWWIPENHQGTGLLVESNQKKNVINQKYKIKIPTGEIITWYNAKFIAIPAKDWN